MGVKKLRYALLTEEKSAEVLWPVLHDLGLDIDYDTVRNALVQALREQEVYFVRSEMRY